MTAYMPRRLPWGVARLAVQPLWAQGITGAGVTIAHLDTGVASDHPALAGKVVGFRFFDDDGLPVPDVRAHDTYQHGTHTAACICGGLVEDMALGVAPDARLYSAVVLEGGHSFVRVLAGLDWVFDLDVRVLVLALGTPGYNPIFEVALQRLRERGVLPVLAVGNRRRGRSMSPGNYRSVLSVGGLTQEDTVPPFSGSGTFEGYSKPDVLAPAVDIVSASPQGGLCQEDGTSQAAAYVAGVAALLLSAVPAAAPDAVQAAIVNTCTMILDAPEGCAGLVNASRALDYLRAHHGCA